jgi:hypothetical protein
MPPVKMSNKDLEMILSLWNTENLNSLPLSLNYSKFILSDLDIQRSMNGLPNLKKELGKVVDCSKSHFPNDLSSILEKTVDPKLFGGFVCINFQYSDYLLGGDLFSGRKLFIDYQIVFDSCNFLPNCTNNPTYGETNPNFNLAYFDNYLNSSSIDGYTKFSNNYLFPFQINQTANLKITLTDNVIITDSNYFYNINPPENNHFLQFESIEFYSSTKSETLLNNHYQLNIQIEIPIYGNKITRNYPKIDSIIASINGIFSIILFVSRLLHSIFNYGYVEHHLMKNLYYINDPLVYDKEKAEFVKSKISSNKDKITRSKLNYLSLNNDQIKKDDASIEINLKSAKISKNANHSNESKYHELKNYLKGKEFEKNWLQWIIISMCPTRNTNESGKYFLYGKSLLYHDLNILVILRKLLYLESWFEILFDDDQRKAMQGINFRVIENDMNVNEVVSSLNKKVLKNKKPSKIEINTFFNAYNNCYLNQSKKSQKIVEKINLLLSS